MPNENKKRGRRAEARKRKLEEQQDDDEGEHGIEHERQVPGSTKRRKSNEFQEEQEQVSQLEPSTQDWGEYGSYQHEEADNQHDPSAVMPFYGLLDDTEQEYFKRADNMLEANEFPNLEDRSLFLENVYKEADGKELKMACSQSCSRLLERLIQLSSAPQLKSLFKKFKGNFLNLVQHRFASHCCEALFIQAAPMVSSELFTMPNETSDPDSKQNMPELMADLYLSAIDDLEGNMGFLITNKFGSHSLRVLLLVLSGQPLDTASSNSLLKSRKKENVDVLGASQATDMSHDTRSVPDSFKSALEGLIEQVIQGLDTQALRTLATHKIANPLLQLLLQLDSTSSGKQRAKTGKSLLKMLLPDDSIKEGTDSASFINGIIYDPIGSHLVESIVQNAPGKVFKSLCAGVLKERLGALSRNEMASYVAARVLERLSHDDLVEAQGKILPQIPNLAERGRTAIIRTLIKRCDIRKVGTAPLADALRNFYTNDNGKSFSLAKLLHLSPDIKAPTEAFLDSAVEDKSSAIVPKIRATRRSRSDPLLPSQITSDTSTNVTHASLLAQAMLQSPGSLATMIFASISALSPELCLRIAFTNNLSPILQTSLTVPHAPIIFRRKLIIRFYSRIGALSLDPSGSHFVDAILHGTQGLAFVRERIAEELAENENALRDSPYGRKVWRNWRMDLYRRRRGEWVRVTRESAGNDGFLSFPGGASDASGKYATNGDASSKDGNSGSICTSHQPKKPSNNSSSPKGAVNAPRTSGKTRLELARERFARSSNLVS